MADSTIRRKLLAMMLLACASLLLTQGIAQAQFGIASFSASLSESQAGAHADFSTSFAVNTEALGNPIGQLQNATVALPPGLLGNPQSIERCSIADFQRLRCPAGSQVGVLTPTIVGCTGHQASLEAPAEAGASTITVPDAGEFCSGELADTVVIGSGSSAQTVQLRAAVGVHTLELAEPLTEAHASGEPVTQVAKTASGPLPLFNLQPSPGHVATFATSLLLASVYIQVNVGSGGRLIATLSDVTTLIPVEASTLTLWGVPADPSHDARRCNELGFEEDCNIPSIAPPVPFMTSPTECATPLQAALSVSSWQGGSAEGLATMPAPTGCEKLAIAPTLAVAPTTTRRDTPAGYEVDLKEPQNQEAYGLATPAFKDLSVTLPAGTSLSPALANGLQACTEAQFGVGACPAASKVGTAEIATPLLPNPLRGAVYIGAPTATEKYRLFLLVGGDGVYVEIAGQVEPNEATGQLTTVFQNVPPLPFTDFKLNFFGGPAAALTNPASCGAATSHSLIEAYSGQTADPSSVFEINEGPEGGACTASPFAPTFVAGVTNPLAGSFSPFTFTLARADGEQNLSAFTAQLPPGLGVVLKGVPVCLEPQAAEGDCAQASQVGTAVISVGSGPLPVYATGPVYLTGPYEGAPFGLTVAIGAAGPPFEFGTLVIRSRVLVNRRNLAVTIASSPLAQTVDGVPLRLRAVNVTLSRPGFLVNPTNCEEHEVTAVVESAQGASADLASPFEVNGCAALKFAPHVRAHSQALANNPDGNASLAFSIANAPGANTNLRSVDIRLPEQLRPRVAETRNACLDTEPAFSVTECPASSVVGRATVNTPLLPAPLTGPMYLVARGGSKTPLLVVLLQGQGLSVELVGSLELSASGRANAVFRELPDVPISALEVEFPGGSNALLGSTESLCSSHLRLAYRLTGQNASATDGTAAVSVLGCSKPTVGSVASRRHRPLSAKRRARK